MMSMMKKVGLLAALAVVALAQDADVVGPHGGVVRAAGALKVEVALDRQGAQAFVVGADGQPIELRKVEGRLEVRPATGEARSVELRAARGGPSRLEGRLDLARVGEGEATVALTLTNLPGADGPVSIEAPFRLARLLEWVCPMRCVPAQAEPGSCSRCHMALVAAPYIYACPMHPEVTSRDANEPCWRCKMRLTRSPAQGGQGGHGGHGGH
jgi:hypothetical protein